MRRLQHDPEPGLIRGKFKFAVIVPSDRDFSFRRFVEAREEIDERRFSAAGRADERDDFAGLDRQADVFQALSLEFFNNLKETYNNDLKTKMTSKGPHKDDFLIEIDEKNSRIYSSAGQQRSALLALKISELDIIRYYSDISPVLLLDDVFSELDRGRI